MKKNVNSDTEKAALKTVLEIERLHDFIANTEHEYQTTHQRLCFAIIARIYTRVLKGYRFGAIKISNQRLIIDGNHRYIAYKLADIKFETIQATCSFCDKPKNFNEVEIDVIQDWDANNPYNKRYCNDDFLKEDTY